ncbi:hypothetical protein FCM35_KLT19520 [Carex littledalei]|uniref:Uncharacterized protein n=1 Tax=Carex littledalei TaxID=544730 RepID=A0A833RLV9_9POAL|nr:hypothetical protein FCM35_KLT19520 [Carex littledalei]
MVEDALTIDRRQRRWPQEHLPLTCCSGWKSWQPPQSSSISYISLFCLHPLTLVELVMKPLSPEPDWMASKEVQEIWELLKGNYNLTCVHIHRSHNELADG